MSSTVAEAGNMTVVTEVLSPKDPRVQQLRQNAPEKTRDSSIAHTFKKAQPKALGTVQIVVGLLEILFGIVVTTAEISQPSLTTSSGVYFWVGIIFFVCGCVTVAAEVNDIPRLVLASIGLNLLGLLLGGAALIVHIIELSTVVTFINEGRVSDFVLKLGCNVVFQIFILLELATTVTIAVFGWKAFRSVQQYSPMD